MGEEHSHMEDLMALAQGRKVAGPSMPEHGFGGGTPNWKLLRCAVWLLTAAFSGDKRRQAAAVLRARAFLEEMRARGHFSIGTAVEVLTPSHAQLWYAGLAALLWGARLCGSSDLETETLAVWQPETAACRLCTYSDEEGLRVLTPGARSGSPKKPKVVNSVRDKAIAGLLSGWLREPAYGKRADGGYNAAIPLLSHAFAEGIRPAALLGSGVPELAPYGFHAKRNEAGDFFAWFDNLQGAEKLHGAGHIDGKVILEWDRGAAIDFGRRFEE